MSQHSNFPILFPDKRCPQRASDARVEKKHRFTLGTFTPREDEDVVIIMATYFSEIGKSISNLLTKDLKLVDKITVTTADGAKSETCVNTSASSLTHKTTITRDIIDGIKADIVLDANARSVSTTLTANDVILNGLKVDLKTGNLTTISEVKANVLEKASLQYKTGGMGMKCEMPLASPNTVSVNVCSDILGSGTSVGVDGTLTTSGQVQSYGVALQKCQGDATYAVAADNGLDRLKFGMSTKLSSDMNGAIECVVGRSSGSLAYAVGLQNSNTGARAVYNSQGTVDLAKEVSICDGAKANVVVQAHLASKTYKTGVAFDIKA